MLEKYSDVLTPAELAEILHLGMNSTYRLL